MEAYVPKRPSHRRFLEATAGDFHTAVLYSDGTVEVWGESRAGQCNVVPLPAGLRYTSVASSQFFTLAIRSDGAAVPWGVYPSTTGPQFQALPPLPFGVSYIEASAGASMAALRRSDGQVVQFGTVPPWLRSTPPLDPDTSYLSVSVNCDLDVVSRIGPTSTYVSFAPGCAGTLPASRLVPQDTPAIAKTHEVIVFDLPQNLAFLLFGWSRTAPQSLDSFGMPGCTAHVSPDGVFFLAGQAGNASYRMSIPNLPVLVGQHFFNQALVLDAGANALGVVASDAAEGVIGDW